MYTEIYDQRTIYFDAVSFSNYLDVPFEQWLRDQPSQPTTARASTTRSASTTTKTTPCPEAASIRREVSSIKQGLKDISERLETLSEA
mmetsp:Transcript_33910/g.97500  ORF Transcript_33910/g.97500 Transcript_33910/m.97500 type:complete len:88 (-) Transcript_33910:77-340(-)